MSVAARAFTRYAFRQFSLTRIFAVPYADNVASQKVLEKAGYLREGILKRSAIKGCRVLDQALWAITDRDLDLA
jgi:RimJ/RimL family protein N-acetyltransferase